MKGSACISPKDFHFSFLSLREATGTSWVLSSTKAQKKEKKETIDKKKKRTEKVNQNMTSCFQEEGPTFTL